MAGFPLTFAVPLTLPDTAPLLEIARLDPLDGVWAFDFDQVLRPGSLDPANFVLKTTLATWTPTTVGYFGKQVGGLSASAPPTNPGNTADYFATPPQLRNMKQTLVAPIVDFPLTLI